VSVPALIGKMARFLITIADLNLFSVRPEHNSRDLIEHENKLTWLLECIAATLDGQQIRLAGLEIVELKCACSPGRNEARCCKPCSKECHAGIRDAATITRDDPTANAHTGGGCDRTAIPESTV
jgi:hypothetical protein